MYKIWLLVFDAYMTRIWSDIMLLVICLEFCLVLFENTHTNFNVISSFRCMPIISFSCAWCYGCTNRRNLPASIISRTKSFSLFAQHLKALKLHLVCSRWIRTNKQICYYQSFGIWIKSWWSCWNWKKTQISL